MGEIGEGKIISKDKIRRYEWKYYKFDIISSSAGVVTVRERGEGGLLWVYVSYSG